MYPCCSVGFGCEGFQEGEDTVRVTDEEVERFASVPADDPWNEWTRKLALDLQSCRLALEKANRALAWLWDCSRDITLAPEVAAAVRAAREEVKT
jgi:hypothetical protein